MWNVPWLHLNTLFLPNVGGKHINPSVANCAVAEKDRKVSDICGANNGGFPVNRELPVTYRECKCTLSIGSNLWKACTPNVCHLRPQPYVNQPECSNSATPNPRKRFFCSNFIPPIPQMKIGALVLQDCFTNPSIEGEIYCRKMFIGIINSMYFIFSADVLVNA